MEHFSNKRIIQKTQINSGFAGEVFFVKTEDLSEYVIKSYNSFYDKVFKNEWVALNTLYRNGFSVPKPYEKNDENRTIAMEKINGGTLWDTFTQVDNKKKSKLVSEFAYLLFQLHLVNTKSLFESTINTTNDFIESELNEIKKLCHKYELGIYSKLITKIEKNFSNLANQNITLIHRDYHPWNVLLDENKKLYMIDLEGSTGDFRFDVAWTYTLMERSGYKDFSDAFLIYYEALLKEKIVDFEFFKYLATLRWLFNVKSSCNSSSNENNFINSLIKKAIEFLEQCKL